MNLLDKTEIVLKDKIVKLQNSKIAILGIGGVGGAVFEMLVRLGVLDITVVDFDRFDVTNLNRQILCTTDVVGEYKVNVARQRAKSINKDATITVICEKISADNLPIILNQRYDFVIDAIDDVKAKIAVILYCNKNNIPLICSMGTGNRYDVPRFEIADIFKTSGDALARKIRSELKKVKFNDKVKCVYTSKPLAVCGANLGSVVYYPIACASVIVGYVTNQIINNV